MGAARITYNSGSTVVFDFKRGPANFIAQDDGRAHNNLSTSGVRERVFEKADILIGFTMPGLLIGDDFVDWKNFYAWAIAGGSFAFAPNLSVTYAPAPWSGGLYYFTCTLEDTGFVPKRAGFKRYAIDCKFRVVNDALTPANSGSVMSVFWGGQP